MYFFKVIVVKLRTGSGQKLLLPRTSSKYTLAKYTQAFSASNITTSQRTKTIYIFFIVPQQYYQPLLQVCRFLYSLSKKVTGQTISSRSLITCVGVLFIAFTRISTKSVEPIANFKPRGKCIWLIVRVVAQTSVYYISCAFN